MNRHASMNRIFRLVWNESLNAYVPAAETARGRGKSSHRKLIAAALSLSAGIAQAGPTGGQVTGGSGTITQGGSTTTISQVSQNLFLNWQTFNIAPQETVDFVQPNASAIAVNRIVGTNGSSILGHLDANGQVYLINPNGVIFGKGAQVNVGGLVASTLAFDPSTIGSASKTFSGTGTGSVLNEGTITAATGGSVALIGNHVGSTGIISAQLGTVALGAGSATTLTFNGTSLVKMQVDQGVLNSVASNGGLIRADGGHVLMTAGAKDSLLASVVNNTGIIEARTVENHEGTITLLGGMSAGTVDVGGTLDVSAARGNGGSIETSAAHVDVANSANVTSAAEMGLSGTWLIDPVDFTIAASGGDITGAALSTELHGGNITIQSSSGTHGGTAGNIDVDDAVSWAAHTLTLTAVNIVNVNAVMTVSGSAKVDFEPGSGNLLMGFASNGTFAGRVNISSSAANALTIGGQVYTVINSVGAAGDAISAPATATLQGIAALTNLGGHFALGSNIDATTTSSNSYNGADGFISIGNSSTPFTGTLDGLGHTITSLTINQGANNVGLFGYVDSAGIIRNIGLTGGSVSGVSYVGSLVGLNKGSISNASSSVTMTATGSSVGGLVGYNAGGNISDSYATGTVSNGTTNNRTGGLVGWSAFGTISDSYATGNVSGSYQVGGLVGFNDGPIVDSYATGTVNGGTLVGGLVGMNFAANISNSYATGGVTGGDDVGGFVGKNYGIGANPVISNSYAMGSVTGNNSVGGLVGWNYSGTISGSHATGTVNGSNNVGGLVGLTSNYGSTSIVTQSYATGAITATSSAGGLIGHDSGGTISDSYATGSISSGDFAGGLVGYLENNGSVSNSYASGIVNGTGNYTGGLIGYSYGSAVSNSYATGTVSGAGGVGNGGSVGGLAGGVTNGTVSESYSTGAVSGSSYVGALVGRIFNTTVSNSFYSKTGNTGLTGFGTFNGHVPDVAGTVWGLTTAQFQTQAEFTSAIAPSGNNNGNGNVDPGWDFSGAGPWFMYEGETAPLLRSFLTPLTVTATDATKTYDGVGYSGGNGLTYSAAPDMSHLYGTSSFTGSSQGAINAGTYTLTPGLYSDQLGYLISYVSGSLSVTARPVNLTGTAVYDRGTTFAASDFTVSHLVGNQTLTLSGTGSVPLKTVAAGPQIVTTTNLTLGDGTNGGLAANYTLVGGTDTASFTPAPLTVGGTTTVTPKVYDSTTAATLAGGTLTGVVTGDAVTLNQTGTFTNKNVANNIPVNATETLSGTDAGNYSVTQPTGLTGNITPAPLTVAGTLVTSKTYDGGTVATLTGGTLTGVYSGDTVTLTQSGTFASPHAGTGIAVTASDSIGGATVMDYTIVEPTGLTGTITPAPLTVTGSTVASKVYDATTTAALSGGTLSGVIGGDMVTLSQSGNFATKNAGTGIAVTATDTLSGASAGDYTVVEPTGLTGTITPASVSIGGSTVVSKTYDGTTAATLANGTLTGVFSGDTVTLNQTGLFANKNAGTGIAVTATDTLSGANAGDYTVVEPTGLTGTITPAALTVAGTTVATKNYDGTTVAMLAGGTLPGVVSGDTVTLNQSGTFATKSAGTGIAVTATDSISGANASNYTLVEPTGLTGTIAPASVSVSGTVVAGKTYDGTNVASLSGGTLSGVLPGDGVSLLQSGFFANAGPGTHIAVTATDSLSGTDAGDYAVVEPTGLSGSITPAAIGPTSSSSGPGGANNVVAQLESSLVAPQFSGSPKVITASSTVGPFVASGAGSGAAGAAANGGDAVSGNATAAVVAQNPGTTVNVSMTIGGAGTLSIENGGLRLPGDLPVIEGNQ
jgi:filamentous hemagglutinin family protein